MLKQVGTSEWSKERLKMSLDTPTSCSTQFLSEFPTCVVYSGSTRRLIIIRGSEGKY